MPAQLSSGEREYAVLVEKLHALEQDLRSAHSTVSRTAHGLGLDGPTQAPAAAAPQGDHVRLPDGAEIVVRPIERTDRHELNAGFRRLGAATRLERFGRPVDRLTPDQLTELTEVDHDAHEALVAFAAETGEGIGVARYVRAPDDSRLADLTCTVTDLWQGRGVGGALVERLATQAGAAGIERFRTTTLVGNEAARRLLRRVAPDVTEHRDGGVVEAVGRMRTSAP